MDEKNRELLAEVIKDRLTNALKDDADDKSKNKIFDEAMDAIDRQIELSKLDASYEEQIEKRKMDKQEMKRDEEFKQKEAKRTLTIRVVEVSAALLLSPLIDIGCKKAFARMICNFEKDYTFTTTAGRSLSSLFRFKK